MGSPLPRAAAVSLMLVVAMALSKAAVTSVADLTEVSVTALPVSASSPVLAVTVGVVTVAVVEVKVVVPARDTVKLLPKVLRDEPKESVEVPVDRAFMVALRLGVVNELEVTLERVFVLVRVMS